MKGISQLWRRHHQHRRWRKLRQRASDGDVDEQHTSRREFQSRRHSETQPARRDEIWPRKDGVASCPATAAKEGLGGDEIRARSRIVFRWSYGDYRWDGAEAREGPTCGRSANRA